jgi:hypothetical protein
VVAACGLLLALTGCATPPGPPGSPVPDTLNPGAQVGAPGRFSAVTQIQRIRTLGGEAPSSGCDSRSLGRQQLVPHRADYRLFTSA